MENRRLLLAVFLSALVLIVWYAIFPPPPQPRSAEGPLPGPETEQFEQLEEGMAPDVDDSGESATEADEPDAEPLIAFEGDSVAAELEEHPVLENDTVRLELSNRGAQLLSFRLKQHETEGGESLELVRDRGSDPYPFALVAGGDKSHRLNKALFVWSRGPADPEATAGFATGESEPVGVDESIESPASGIQTLSFRHRSDRGAAEKTFSLTPDGLLKVKMTVLGDRDWSVVIGPGLRNLSEKEANNRFVQREVGYRRGETLETIAPAKQDSDEFIPALGLRWVTLEDNFFLVAVMPRDGVKEVVVRPIFQRVELDPDRPRFLPLETSADTEDLRREQILLLEASGQQMEVEALFGAKRYSRLVAMPYGLEETVRWGWFGFLAKPLYYALEWIYQRIVPNYGWAIVLVTLLIRVLFFPLTHKGQESMGKMQELNPKVQAIRTKYRSKLKDKQGRPNAEAQRQMNEEVMKVYKAAGVNPAGGCFPILLQMPVFFAFFRLLSTAVELRGAPWIGWIHDLSVPDPFYVLPILMGVTSVAMQKMMPAAPDPMQRRMMQLLPIMFMFFAFAFPSGLVLYWVTNNLLSMVQQGALMKLKQRRQAAAD